MTGMNNILRRSGGNGQGNTAACNNSGNSCGCRKNPLKELYELDFAITDIQMYIDMYPDSPEAQDYKNRLLGARAGAVEAFERAYGPLTQYSPGVNADGLMPWQYGYGETHG